VIFVIKYASLVAVPSSSRHSTLSEALIFALQDASKSVDVPIVNVCSVTYPLVLTPEIFACNVEVVAYAPGSMSKKRNSSHFIPASPMQYH
jgi:hypothetical protein